MRKTLLIRWFAGLVTALAFAALTGCSALGMGGPKIQNHPSPTLSVDSAIFLEAGCPADEFQRRSCPEGSSLNNQGCTELRDPGDFLGGLAPSTPINLCIYQSEQGEEPSGGFLYREGCLMPAYVSYVIYRDGEFVVINSIEELGQAFLPIDSENEALSYALAATGLGVRYGQEALPGLEYFVDELEDTHVVKTPDGYQVLLFDYKLCGCGPHHTYAVEILVQSDGRIEETSRVPIFKDPEEDGLCVD